jgi:hypothetical protein
MKRRRITITAFRRRRTVVIPGRLEGNHVEPAGNRETTLVRLAGERPEPISKTTLEKRRNDHERNDENCDDARSSDLDL